MTPICREHHLPVLRALEVNYAPLNTGESVTILRLDNDLTLDTAPGASTVHAVSLLASSSDTFTELDSQIDLLSGYSASVQGSSGSAYSYTIQNTFSIDREPVVNPDDNVIFRHYDNSLMESPARILQQLLTPTFANTGTGYNHEVKLLDFANKE